MEVVICAVYIGIWWISSVTVLLPFVLILKHSKFLRDKWFTFFFMRVMKPAGGSHTLPLRKKAFDLLLPELPEGDSKDPLKFLEIGIGSGANLSFYPRNSLLTALDMNPGFETHFRAMQAKYPHVLFDKLITSYAEDMKDVGDASVDVVVSTNVLCSAKSVPDCLKEIKRVLKPGGKFLFMNHVAFPQSDWSYILQTFANPLWVIFFDGCNLTRDTVGDIKKAGFSQVVNDVVYLKTFPLLIQPHAYGLATK